jgi:hypothetical protein
MARIKQNPLERIIGNGKKVTSIGGSKRTRPKNKNKRRNFKKSRGQGSGRR